MKTKHKGKTFDCDKCDKKCNSRSSLQYHTQSVHEDGTKYKCDVCEHSTFVNKSSLTQHIKSVHLKEKFDCKLCEYKAGTKGTLYRHFDSVHKTNIIICQICKKKMKKISLAKHMKISHSDQNSLHYCKMCPFQTMYKYNLKTHTENVHQKLGKRKN